jgi:hypothetical protein
MSLEETNVNHWDRARAGALNNVEPGTTWIIPWRMEANQDLLYKGLEICGCACCPDEPEDGSPR